MRLTNVAMLLRRCVSLCSFALGRRREKLGVRLRSLPLIPPWAPAISSASNLTSFGSLVSLIGFFNLSTATLPFRSLFVGVKLLFFFFFFRIPCLILLMFAQSSWGRRSLALSGCRTRPATMWLSRYNLIFHGSANLLHVLSLSDSSLRSFLLPEFECSLHASSMVFAGDDDETEELRRQA